MPCFPLHNLFSGLVFALCLKLGLSDAIKMDFPFLSGTCPEQGWGVSEVGHSRTFSGKKISPESEGGSES